MSRGTDKAKDILRKYWDEKVPVDPKAIAERLGVEVRGEGLDFDESGPLSGRFDIENYQPIIRFNVTDILERQRFTIAHELGHFVLGHGGGFRDPTQSFSLDNFDPKEAACNRFAAELLMPEAVVRYYVMDRSLEDLRELAKRFQVSTVAMKHRLANLGWITA